MKKWLKIPSFLTGIILILFFGIPAVLGYLITPDDSTDCNDIIPQAANLPPGTTIQFLRVKPGNQTENQGVFSIWLSGRKSPGSAVAVEKVLSTNADSVRILEMHGGMQRSFARKNLVDGEGGHFLQTRRFWLGSDRFGRDVFSRLIIGARVSLFVGLVSVLISLFLGIIIGLFAGYSKGWTDHILSWVIAVFWSVPTLLIALGLSFIFGKGLGQVLVAVGLSTWVEVARVVRGQTMQLREKEFILAAKITGFSQIRILFRHILPNLKGSLTVLATTNFAAAIMLESGLSFLGLGIAPPAPSWGIMVSEHRGNLVLDSAYLALIPGAAIMLLVMGFNLLSLGFRDALDTNLNTTN